MKKMKTAIGIVLVAALLCSSACGQEKAEVTVSTDIEKSSLDKTVEDVNVALEEGERYSNPIPDENQPYRDNSIEAQLLDGIEEKDVVQNSSRTGDPYVLRYNGKYYLYCSTDGWTCTYRCWESLDLITYTYLGEFDLLDEDGKRPEDDDEVNQGYTLECAWAPEVHYWNGQFYMYTSPHASRNLVLQSTTGLPYGDYKLVNKEFSIYNTLTDPSWFIDDNEDKWFVSTYVGSEAERIVVAKASDMATLESKTASAYLPTTNTGITGECCEGPFLFKRYGVYYMVTTGEGVGRPAYRLNYAYNVTGLGNELNIGSVGGAENWSLEIEPNVILNTEGDFYGYGHGCVVVGPDLDSYWFPYHMSRYEGVGRMLGVNRIVFSGSRMSVVGQDKETLKPSAPTFYTSYFGALSDTDKKGEVSGVIARSAGYRSYTDERTAAGEGLHEVNGQLLSGKYGADGNTVELIKTGSRFTAEYNFKDVATDGSFKCLFGGGYVTIKGQTVELYKGTEKIAEAPMLVANEETWDWSAYHSIVVTYEEGRIAVTIDGCMKIDVEATGLGNDAIGFEGAQGMQIGGASFSDHAFGSSDRDEAKMVEGSFYASNYYEAKEGESATKLSSESSLFTVETKEDEDEATYGPYLTYHIYRDALALKLAEGDRAVYKIDVAEDGLYAFEALFANSSDGSVIKVQIDEEEPTCYVIRKNDYSVNTYQTEYYESLQYQKRVIDEIKLKKGLHTLTVRAVQGDFTAIEYTMTQTSETAPEYSDTLAEKGGHDYYTNWMIKDSAHYAAFGSQSLVRFGGSDFTDYKVKVDIKTNAMMSRANKAGILLRVTEPSVFWRQTYGSGKGYFVCIDAYGISLERFDYNERLVAYYETELDQETWYTLEAECIDNTIIVYLDGKEVIRYVDPYGFACGATALYSYQAETYYKNLEISPK